MLLMKFVNDLIKYFDIVKCTENSKDGTSTAILTITNMTKDTDIHKNTNCS